MKNYRLLLGLLTFLGVYILFSPTQVRAVDYFVDSVTGKDTNTGLEQAAPYKTLFKLNQADLNGGDRVYLKTGSVFEGPLLVDAKDAGYAGNPVTITSYGTGTKPVIKDLVDNEIDGIYYQYDTSYKRAIEIFGGYINLSNIRVDNSEYTGVEIFEVANNVKISNFDFRKIGMGVTIKSSNNVVENSTFDEFNMVRNTLTPEEDDYGAIAINLNADGAQRAGLGGITGNIITRNTVNNAFAPSYDYAFDGGFVEIFKNVDNTIISYNKVYNSKGFIEIGGSGEEINGLTLHHNLSYHNGLFSFVNYGTYGVTFKNYNVYNNTLYEPNLSVPTGASELVTLQNTADDRSKTAFWFDGVTATSPTKLAAGLFTLRNNIIYGRTTISNKEPSVHSNNVFYRFNMPTLLADKQVLYLGFNLATGEKYADPQFTDPTKINFTLKSTSPAINTGYNLTTATTNGVALNIKTDLNNAVTPFGTAFDIGAFESQTAVVPTSSPTVIPTPSPSPKPTVVPTPSPSPTVVPTPSPSPTVKPTVAPSPTPVVPVTYYRIDAGATVNASINGTNWEADKYSTGGTPGALPTTVDILGTTVDLMYQSERHGLAGKEMTYSLPVVNGTYTVKLYFAEPFHTAVGKRVFDVLIEGNRVLDEYDIFKSVGRYTKDERTYRVTVTDGKIDIVFPVATADKPIVSGIEVTN